MDASIKAVLAGSADSINTAALNHGIPRTMLKKLNSLEELLMELIKGLCLIRKKKSWWNTSFKQTRWAMEKKKVPGQNDSQNGYH